VGLVLALRERPGSAALAGAYAREGLASAFFNMGNPQILKKPRGWPEYPTPRRHPQTR
jgi:hypothetical protein